MTIGYSGWKKWLIDENDFKYCLCFLLIVKCYLKSEVLWGFKIKKVSKVLKNTLEDRLSCYLSFDLRCFRFQFTLRGMGSTKKMCAFSGSTQCVVSVSEAFFSQSLLMFLNKDNLNSKTHSDLDCTCPFLNVFLCVWFFMKKFFILYERVLSHRAKF